MKNHRRLSVLYCPMFVSSQWSMWEIRDGWSSHSHSAGLARTEGCCCVLWESPVWSVDCGVWSGVSVGSNCWLRSVSVSLGLYGGGSLSLSLTAPRTLSRIVTTIQNTAIQQYNTTVHFPGNVVSLKRNRQNWSEVFIKLSFVCLAFTHELTPLLASHFSWHNEQYQVMNLKIKTVHLHLDFPAYWGTVAW